MGVRGVWSGWNYDGSGQYGHNSFAFTIGDTLNVSLGPTLPPNQTEFDAGTLQLNQFVGNVDISRPFKLDGLAGPINVAFGAELRRENYQIAAGEPVPTGTAGWPTSSAAGRPSARRSSRGSAPQRGR